MIKNYMNYRYYYLFMKYNCFKNVFKYIFLLKYVNYRN